MTEDAMKAMHQQFTTALGGLTKQNVELQNELAQSRHQAANELAALRQEVRGSPLRGSQVTGSEWTRSQVTSRVHRKPGETGELFKGYGGAAVPRLQKLMDDAAKATAPIPNATILDDDDQAATAQLYMDDAHDLQRCSSQHRVPGGRQPKVSHPYN